MSLIAVVLVTLIIVTFLAFRQSIRSKFEYLRNVPGPKPIPIFGNALMFRNNDDFLPTVCDCLKKYGKTFVIWTGPTFPNVITTDYKFIESLLRSPINLRKSWQYNFLHSWLGFGLLTSDSIRWRKHRKMITPAFHFLALTKFVNVLKRPTAVLLKILEKKVDLPSFDIFNYVNLYSLDVMCELIRLCAPKVWNNVIYYSPFKNFEEVKFYQLIIADHIVYLPSETSMGMRVDAQENSESEYVSAVKEMGKIFMRRSFSLFGQHDFLYKFTSDYKKEKEALRILHGYTRSVIEKRRREIEENQSKVQMNDDTEKRTFLDILLHSTIDDQPLTDDIIREEVDTFMFEGHDTTSSGISFALFCIASHPEVQEKVLEEQIQLYGTDKNPRLRFNDLQNMKYLDMVIKETLRLYPSAPVFGRTLVEDMVIDGQLYSRGLNVHVFAYGLHRDPQLFPNPDDFIPSRFEDMGSENPFAYIPFSAGHRNCIGQKYAMSMMKYAISSLVRHFEFYIASDDEKPFVVSEIILRSQNGIKIGLKKRNY